LPLAPYGKAFACCDTSPRVAIKQILNILLIAPPFSLSFLRLSSFLFYSFIARIFMISTKHTHDF
jgi:hypothetical protein